MGRLSSASGFSVCLDDCSGHQHCRALINTYPLVSLSFTATVHLTLCPHSVTTLAHCSLLLSIIVQQAAAGFAIIASSQWQWHQLALSIASHSLLEKVALIFLWSHLTSPVLAGRAIWTAGVMASLAMKCASAEHKLQAELKLRLCSQVRSLVATSS